MSAKIKLVASASQSANQTLSLQVLPALVLPEDDLFVVDDEFNGVQLKAAFAGRQFLKSRGAGSHPTGSAVRADVAAALAGYRYKYTKGASPAIEEQAAPLQLYIRAFDETLLADVPLQEVMLLTEGQRDVQLLGSISRAELFAHQEMLEQAGVFVALLPEGLSRESLLAATAERYLYFA